MRRGVRGNADVRSILSPATVVHRVVPLGFWKDLAHLLILRVRRSNTLVFQREKNKPQNSPAMEAKAPHPSQAAHSRESPHKLDHHDSAKCFQRPLSATHTKLH